MANFPNSLHKENNLQFLLDEIVVEILFPGNEDFSADKNIFSKYKFGGYYYDCVEKDYSFTTFAKFSEKLTFIAP